VDLSDGISIEFMADTPAFYRGTVELRENAGRTVVALKDAERVDTSKGSAFGSKPPMPTPAASS